MGLSYWQIKQLESDHRTRLAAESEQQPLVDNELKELRAEHRRLEDDLKELRAEHRRELDELRQLIGCREGPVADREGTAEPDAPDTFELARSMFDAVLLVGSRSPDAPVGPAVTMWALQLFILNMIIQVLIVAVVVNNIATDQLIGPDLIADFWCASASCPARPYKPIWGLVAGAISL
jgi:hypothetical protein